MAYGLKLSLLTHWEGRRPLALCFFCCWVFACTHAYGQFTSVINIPSDVAPGVLGSNTQLNLNDGGIFRRGLEIGDADGSSTNIEVNIDGGQASGDLTVNAGGSLNFRKGFTGTSFSTITANDGSRVSLSGGRIGALLSVNQGSHVEIIGSDFRFNGQPIDAATISMNEDFLRESRIPDFFSATLSDGTPLILASYPRIESLRLTEVALPYIDTTPIVIGSSAESVPIGLRPGQALSVLEGGSLAEQFYAVGSSIHIAGGEVGPAAQFSESQVTISSGTVASRSIYAADSRVTLDGGTLRRPVFDKSHLVVNGGVFSGDVLANWQSTIVVNDGLFEATADILNQIQLFDSSFTIHGGSAEDVIANGGVIAIHWGEVRYANANRNPLALFFDDVSPGSLIEMTSGVVRSSIRVGFQSELHLGGGTVGGPETGQRALDISGGKAVITGGVINGDVWVSSSLSELNINGGNINGNLTASAGSVVNLLVQDLSIDGTKLELFPGEALDIVDRDLSLLQATPADGSFFELELNNAGPGEDFISPDAFLTIRLVPEPTAVALAMAFLGVCGPRRSRLQVATLLACIAIIAPQDTAHAQFTTVINVPPDTAPQQVSSDTQVNVLAGGSLPSGFLAGAADGSSTNVEVNITDGVALFGSFDANPGSVVNVAGGRLDNRFTAAGGVVNISGGSHNGDFNALAGSEVNLSGGTITGPFFVLGSGVVNVSGTASVERLSVRSGGEVNLLSGSVGFGFTVRSGGVARLSGGTVGGGFDVFSGSDVELVGGEFRLNGVEFTGSSIKLDSGIAGEGDVFTGTLADGSAFIFSDIAADSLRNVTLTSSPPPAIDTTPRFIDTPETSGPSGLRSGEVLTVRAGGQLRDDFAVVDATLNVSGGTVGDFTEVAGGTVNVTGGVLGESLRAYNGSKVNISGGVVGSRLLAFPGSEVNISGGEVDFGVTASDGSTVNVSGGRTISVATRGGVLNVSGGMLGGSSGGVSGGFSIQSGEVNLSGGTIGRVFSLSDSDIELIGGEFKLNGADFGGSRVVIEPDDVLSGTFEDGSSFVFSSRGEDDLPTELRLTHTSLPAPDSSPTVINSPLTSGPFGLRAGQSLTVQSGGALPENFAVVEATLDVEAGTVGSRLEVDAGNINVSGGAVGGNLYAYRGSQINMSGGEIVAGTANVFDSLMDISGGNVQSTVNAEAGSIVNISGGNVGPRFFLSHAFNAGAGSEVNISSGRVGRGLAASGGVVNISGGTVGGLFTAEDGSTVNLSGGTVGTFFNASIGSDVELFGGEFRLNGVEFTGDDVTLGPEDILTGTLTDGSTFVFSPLASDVLQGVTLTTTELPDGQSALRVVDSLVTDGPNGLRADETLTLMEGGVLRDNFAVVDATLNVEGGTLGTIEVSGGVVNIFSGDTDQDSRFLRFAPLMTAFAGSVVNISGGTGTADFAGHTGSEINLLGSGFLLDGVPLEGLASGVPFPVTSRDVRLSGRLTDGSLFDTFITSTNRGEGFVSPNALLTVTLVPEPSAYVLLANGLVIYRRRRR